MKILYRGDFNSPSGYSRAIRAHVRALLMFGVEVGAELHKHDISDAPLDAFWKAHMPQVLVNGQKFRGEAKVRIWHETPEFYDPNPDHYNIGFVVWETTKIPDFNLHNNPAMNWVHQMNRMDEIWTASEWCRKAFRNSGVTVPICVFPHPIDLDAYRRVESIPSIFNLEGSSVTDSKFVLLSVFQWNTRKNPAPLIVGFTSEFATDPKASLMIKSYSVDFKDNSGVVQGIANIRKSMGMPQMVKNVHPVLDLIPDDEMPQFYSTASCFISTTFGEGFGMPFQEAMACGVPCIYPQGTAMDDFIDESCGYPVETDPEPVRGMPHIPWYHGDQDWMSVRMPSLRKQLRKAHADWKSGEIKKVGARARARIEELHSFERVGQMMYDRLSEIEVSIRVGDKVRDQQLDPAAIAARAG